MSIPPPLDDRPSAEHAHQDRGEGDQQLADAPDVQAALRAERLLEILRRAERVLEDAGAVGVRGLSWSEPPR